MRTFNIHDRRRRLGDKLQLLAHHYPNHLKALEIVVDLILRDFERNIHKQLKADLKPSTATTERQRKR